MSESPPAVNLVELDRLQRRSLLVGVVALGICVGGAFLSVDAFFQAYLAAYQFFLGIALGSMVIVMIHHLTGGAWGFLVQRFLEAGMRTLPYLAVLFIPICFGLASLYPWARPEEVAAEADLQQKAIYLNDPFFWGRAALFFALWLLFVWLLDYWSRRLDETGAPRYAARQAALSGPALIVFGISITFAAVDWIMSLEPKFHSTIFGPLVVTGQIVSAHALGIITLAWLAPRTPIAELLSPKVMGDLGNLLFTFLVIWAYMAWFQFMLIWIANLRYEVIWYLPRSTGGWQWVGYALLVFHFIIPFFLLLMRDLKQHLPTLAKVAGLLFVMQLVSVDYLVLPAFPNASWIQIAMDCLMPLGLGGLWLWSYLHELRRRPLLPRNPEDQAEALHLRQLDVEAAERVQEVQNA